MAVETGETVYFDVSYRTALFKKETVRRFIPYFKTALSQVLEGPGKIVHIWCTVAQKDPFYSAKLTLRMYWDDEEHPSVECPLGDFFGIGFGVDKPFTSIPIRSIELASFSRANRSQLSLTSKILPSRSRTTI